MADIACFVERYTVSRAEELTALVNFKVAAHQLGHQLEYVFRKDIAKIPSYDALFIRSLTDPLNAGLRCGPDCGTPRHEGHRRS